MSYDYRIDSTYRPRISYASTETVRHSTAMEAAATGMEKSTALADLDNVRSSAGSINDHGSSAVRPSIATTAQEQSLSFSDLVDVINPLQHIPLVSSAYRAITGDEISAPARVAGSALYFGPIGAVTAIANVAVEGLTGQDMGDHALALLSGGAAGTNATSTIEAANAAQPGQTTQRATINAANTAALSSSAVGSPMVDEELSPDEPFTFNAVTPPAVSNASRAIGFAGTTEPVALDALPADILSALYSGQAVRPTGAGSTGNAAVEANPGAAAGTGSYNSSQQTTPGYAQLVEAAPRWSFWSSPDDAHTTPVSAARAYGGVVPDDTGAQTNIAAQGGWFGANMPEVLARYQDGANLQRQSTRPFLDTTQ